ncbi:hypothetical protein PG989_016346 [Apiospora arundinis]
MASHFEALPNEILDSILEYLINHRLGGLRICAHLDCLSLARLSQCSQFLNRRLEPVLYGTHDARHAALRNGCVTGNLHAIRKAAACGANPGVLRRYITSTGAPVHRVVHADYEAIHREYSSLQMVLKARQLDAFNLLLELGAGFKLGDYSDDKILNSQLKTFAEKLAEVRNVEFLKAFVAARADTPYWPDNRKETYSQAEAVLSRLPFPDVVRWASPALLETLLDNGAQLNQAVQTSFRVEPGKRRPMTPLGAACLRGDAEVFRLLVARGAHVNIDDTLRSKYANDYTHIPILVAVHYLVDTGDSSMLDACVAAGADVNLPCHRRPAPPPKVTYFMTEPPPVHTCTTPLLLYLRLVKSWDMASSDDSGPRHPTLAEGVAHFIHDLGANAPSPVAPPIERGYNNSTQDLHDRNFEGIPSAVELLVVKWGIKSLANPEFFSLIKFLVQHGGTGPDLARLLVRTDGDNETPSDDGKNNSVLDIVGLWEQFLGLLQPQLEALDQPAKDNLLHRVIVDKGTLRHRVTHPSVWVKVRAVGRASIRALLRAGANINHTAGKPTDGYPARTTPLHEVVSCFVHTDCLVEDHLHNHPADHGDCPYTRDVVESFGDFLAFLVSEGADPLARDPRDYRSEKTAVDTLLLPMRQGRIKHRGGAVEQGLLSFVARLQGTDPVAEYTGDDRKPYDKDSDLWMVYCRWSYIRGDCAVSHPALEHENTGR